MKYLKLFESLSNDINEDGLIQKIKRELIFDGLYIVDDEEFKERFNGDFEKAWKEFVDNQDMGDCQGICSAIKYMELPNVVTHFGEIEVDIPSYQEEEVYDEDEDDYIMGDVENYIFTHHWVTINGKIYEFSKGTLKDHIEWYNLYDVYHEGEDKYKYK